VGVSSTVVGDAHTEGVHPDPLGSGSDVMGPGLSITTAIRHPEPNGSHKCRYGRPPSSGCAGSTDRATGERRRSPWRVVCAEDGNNDSVLPNERSTRGRGNTRTRRRGS
jgi:hypothetical protein